MSNVSLTLIHRHRFFKVWSILQQYRKSRWASHRNEAKALDGFIMIGYIEKIKKMGEQDCANAHFGLVVDINFNFFYRNILHNVIIQVYKSIISKYIQF